MSTIDKPCMRKCCIDESETCLGCYRTLNDILDWNTYTEKKKITVLRDAKNLKAQEGSKNHWYAFGSVQ